MPIELFWWIKPLFLTGLVTSITLLPIAVLIADARGDNGLTDALFVLGIMPIVATVLAVAAWLFGNVFILIWRR